MKISSTALHFLAPSQRTVLFALKGFAAIALALGVSITLDLDMPFWAVVPAIFLQARPEAGLVVEKAGCLVLGSFIGAAAGMLILGNFVHYPVMAIACLALCIGGSAFMASTVRHVNFTFLFAMIGITAALIALFAIVDYSHISSGSIFQIVRARLTEVIVGAGSAALASVVIFPFKVEMLLKGHAHNLMNASLGHLIALLDFSESVTKQRKSAQAVIVAAATLSDDSNAGRYEEAQNVRAAVFLANQALSVLAFDQVMSELKTDHVNLDASLTAVIAKIGEGFRLMKADSTLGRIEQLRRIRAEFESAKTSIVQSTPIKSHVFRVAEELLRKLEEMLLALHAIDANEEFTHRVARFQSYRNPIVGGIAAIRSMLVFVTCVAIWALSGGPTTLLMMIILPTFTALTFVGVPNPALAMRKLLTGGLIAIPITILYGLGLLAPATGSFEMLLLVLVGPLFIAMMGITSRDIAPYSLGFCLSFVVLIQPGNYMDFAADRALKVGLGIAAGMLIAYLYFDLIRPPTGVSLQRRTIRSIASCLRKAGTKHYQDVWLNRQMAERLLYLGSHEGGNKHSRSMTGQGLAGLYLGHISVQIHQQLGAVSSRVISQRLEQWRSALHQSYLSCAQGQRDERLKTATTNLLQEMRASDVDSSRFELVEIMLNRIRQTMTQLALANVHS